MSFEDSWVAKITANPLIRTIIIKIQQSRNRKSGGKFKLLPLNLIDTKPSVQFLTGMINKLENIAPNIWYISLGDPFFPFAEGMERNKLSVDDNKIDISESSVQIRDDALLFNSDGIYLTLQLSKSKKKWIRIEIKGEFDGLLGLGEKSDLLDKTGKPYIMWNIDNSNFGVDSDPLYKSIPFGILRGKNTHVGIIINYPGYQIWRGEHGYKLSVDVADDNLQCLIFTGTIKQIMMKYIKITGTPFLPPLWSLGYHQCRWSYGTQKKVMEIASGFEKNDIPCDAIWIDIDYMDNYRCFTWDGDKFPDPRSMIEELENMGIRIITMIDPGIKVDDEYSVYKEGKKEGYFCTIKGGEYHGPVWPGPSAFPDFIDDEVALWWGDLYKSQLELGVHAFWNDMNEPSIFTLTATMPDKVEHRYLGNTVNHQHMHNIFGSKMAEASYRGILRHTATRPFVLSRSAYLGVHQFAWTWTGDNESSWEHIRLSIPKCLGMGLSGLLTGADIGGFRGEPDAELYARWIQLGVFYPFMRTHTTAGTPAQEPWSYGDEVTDIARSAIQLRYQLLPYTYTHIFLHHLTGIPLMRPMFLEFEDGECRDPKWENSQFMYGSNLLIAPVIEKGQTKRQVYLPAGTWHNFYDKAKMEGGQVIDVDAPLDTIPVFVRDNSIIPVSKHLGRNAEETIEGGTEMLEFGEVPVGILYQDDGEGRDHENGGLQLFVLEPGSMKSITVNEYLKDHLS